MTAPEAFAKLNQVLDDGRIADMPLEIGPMNRQERRFHLMIEQSRPLTRTQRTIASALERPATRKA